MKEDKSLMSFGGYDSLIEYQFKKLNDIFSFVYVSAKSNKFNDRIPKKNLIIENSDTFSPMIALREIFNKLNGKVFIITVDIPLITKQSIKEIIQSSKDYKITLAKSGNYTHNLCGVYDTSLIKKVEENLKNDIHKIGYLTKITPSNIINFNNDEFINVNNKEDYDKAVDIYNISYCKALK